MKLTKEKRTRISQEDIPMFTLEEAARVAQAVFENFGKDPAVPLRVAAAMQLAPGGSQFKMLAGASIAYGLTSGGCNAAAITLTPLGKRIFAPTEDGDDLKAKREAFLKPRVIREFVERYNGSPIPKAEIAVNVLVDSGVPRDRAAATFTIITEAAEKLGFLQEIRGKKYFILDKPPVGVAVGNAETPNELEQKTEQLPSGPVTVVTVPANGGPPPAASVLPALDSLKNKRVFITHGKNKSFVETIKKLLQFGEMDSVVSVERQSVSQPVTDKVMNDMRSCGAAIIHVDDELKLMDAEANEHIVLNSNVLIEIGAAIALYGRRFILLVKEGVKLPSNLQGLYEVRYSGETLDGDTTIRLMDAINALKKTAPLKPAGEAVTN